MHKLAVSARVSQGQPGVTQGHQARSLQGRARPGRDGKPGQAGTGRWWARAGTHVVHLPGTYHHVHPPCTPALCTHPCTHPCNADRSIITGIRPVVAVLGYSQQWLPSNRARAPPSCGKRVIRPAEPLHGAAPFTSDETSINYVFLLLRPDLTRFRVSDVTFPCREPHLGSGCHFCLFTFFLVSESSLFV